MKRTISIFLVIVLCLALCACGKSESVAQSYAAQKQGAVSGTWKTAADEMRSGVYVVLAGEGLAAYSHEAFQLHTLYVTPHQVYKTSIYQAVGGMCYAITDAEGNVISYAPGTGEVTEFEITIPEQGAVLYINRYAGGTNNIVVFEEGSESIQAIEAWTMEEMFPLTKAADHMTVTVIDDDTANVGQVKRFYEKCEAAGIKGTFACITAYVLADPELHELLLQYQNEGYQVTYHCHSQIDAYRADTRDFAAAQENFVTGLREMRELGFINYDYWVNPYGVKDEETQSLAKKWGMNCMVTVNQDYENKESDNRFAIDRISLYTAAVEGSDAPQQDPADPAWYQYNFEKLKTAVNNCAAENGWLLICTHMWDNTLWEDSDRLTEFVEYVKSVAPNAQFKTLGEAFTEREPIYRFHEMR